MLFKMLRMKSFSYGDRLAAEGIAQTQAETFEYAQNKGYDMEEFVNGYMNSDFCNREMDSEYSYFHYKPDTVCLAYVKKELSIQPSDEGTKLADPWWVGSVYRYISILTGIHSREVVKLLPCALMDDLSASYETMEDEDAARDIVKRYLKEQGGNVF